MSTTTNTAIVGAQQEEGLTALAACWPAFSAPELSRLRFLVYRRASGRLRPPAPLRAAGARLAAEIAAYLHAPAPQPVPQVRVAAALDVPPLWRAWLEAHTRDEPGR